MTTLNNLKLITDTRNKTISPILHRRNKLITKLDEQLQLCIAKKDGNIYAPKKLKSFTDRHTGERKTIEITKKIKEWYWTNDTGKISLYVKYGSKLLSLNKKGNNAIECANTDDLIETLTTLKKIVANGELDDAITSISKATRLGFGK